MMDEKRAAPSGPRVNDHRQQPEWLDLKALQEYACICERTLRVWIHRPVDALPAVQVGSKFLIRRTTFDQWLENHLIKSTEVCCIVDEVLSDLRK